MGDQQSKEAGADSSSSATQMGIGGLPPMPQKEELNRLLEAYLV
jgi:hypothetical protein